MKSLKYYLKLYEENIMMEARTTKVRTVARKQNENADNEISNQSMFDVIVLFRIETLLKNGIIADDESVYLQNLYYQYKEIERNIGEETIRTMGLGTIVNDNITTLYNRYFKVEVILNKYHLLENLNILETIEKELIEKNSFQKKLKKGSLSNGVGGQKI